MRIKRCLMVLLLAVLTIGILGGCQSNGLGALTEAPQTNQASNQSSGASGASGVAVSEDGQYSSKDEVASYIKAFGHLPSNYVTKAEARKRGWRGGSLEGVLPGCSIGGDVFKNREGLLPRASGRTYYECDVGSAGKGSRGDKRIVYSNDGLVYYSDDHYQSFTLLYGEES